LSAALRGNEEFARGTRRTQGYLASRLSVFRELYGRRGAGRLDYPSQATTGFGLKLDTEPLWREPR
jgi:hypothetical protein